MKLFFCIIIFFIFSCKQERETTSVYKLMNNANHIIEIQMFNMGVKSDSFNISNTQSKEFQFSYRGDGQPAPISLGDSVNVVFDDSLNIVHGSKIYNVKRSLIKTESYNLVETIKQKYGYLYKYEYVFTNADYEEALINNKE